MDIITRCCFSLGDHESVVHVKGQSDFLINIWARNIETKMGGVQVTTPKSQFRGKGSTGPNDSLAMNVPAQTGMNLGSIGGKDGETIDITNAFGARMVVFLTIESASRVIVTTA